MNFYNWLNENVEYNKMNNKQFEDWILSLNIQKRKPKNVTKADHSLLLDILNNVINISKIKDATLEWFVINGKLKMIRLTKDEIDSIYGKSIVKPNIIEKNKIKYIKSDSASYIKFLNSIEIIDNFFKTLKGYHKNILIDLTVKFVDGKTQKSIASYSKNYDIISINIKKVGNTKEEYGSLVYVILHELGHRYLMKYPQNWNIDGNEWVTTKYSTVDNMSGEEKFAELFALSHWPNKYSIYKEIIKKFQKKIK